MQYSKYVSLYWNERNVLMLFDLWSVFHTGSLWSIPVSCRERVSVLDQAVLQMREKSLLIVSHQHPVILKY